MDNVIKITGLDCANCARELEEEIEKIEGVEKVSVDFMAQKVFVGCDSDTLEKVKKVCNNFEEVKVVEDINGERLKIKGLCCANCGRELEEELNKIEGVSARVDFINMYITLETKTSEARERAIYKITHFENVKIVDGQEKKSVIKAHFKEILRICLSILFFIPALVLSFVGGDETYIKVITYVFFGIAYLSAGYEVLILTAKNVVKGKIFDENFLMTIASIGAILLGIFSGDGFVEGVAVMLLYEIGELLQSIAVGASRNSITELMNLKSESATLYIDGEQKIVSPEDLKVGDIIMVKAGEKVPADCKIIKGESALDVKSLSGEPLPKNVTVGDEVLSGSINISTVFYAEVLREYRDSAVRKILDIVENSTAKKSKPEKFITKFAKYYTPAVCLAAAVVAAIVPTIICAVNSSFVWATYANWIYKALGFLVISCPCALVISVPLSYFGGIGRCAKFGILVKGSTCLDSLALSTVAAFDKTGTITEGSFKIKSFTNDTTLALAAAAERFSSHPIAVAFKDIESKYTVENAEELAGMGVKCTANKKELLCGNFKLLAENGVKCERAESVSTLVYVAYDGKFVGVVEIDDSIKSGVREAVAALKAQGVEYTQMLTGDLKERAEIIAKEAGLDGFEAGLLPDQKPVYAEKLKERGKLLYVGDGINDAPVMTVADCAVSMGKVGSDAAIEASDIVLVSDNLSNLPKGRRIAKGTRRIVIQNIIGSLIVKAVIMALDIAIAGFPLIISIVGDVGVMLLAVLNAIRCQTIK